MIRHVLQRRGPFQNTHRFAFICWKNEQPLTQLLTTNPSHVLANVHIDPYVTPDANRTPLYLQTLSFGMNVSANPTLISNKWLPLPFLFPQAVSVCPTISLSTLLLRWGGGAEPRSKGESSLLKAKITLYRAEVPHEQKTLPREKRNSRETQR